MQSQKNKLKEATNRLKKIFDRIAKSKKQQAMPSLVLQPVRR
ncbi:MAG TPA: hypothetical protein PLU37_08265 [Chitinophagaceae bacterium]|nr:hypothetical protein [Chitinophagaceae bacterium]